MANKCKDCGNELLTEWKYCPECGRDLQYDFFSRKDELYYIGRAIPNFGKKQIEFYVRAAELGSLDAKLRLAEIYFFGDKDDVDVDYKEALKWRLSYMEQKHTDDWDLGCYLFPALITKKKEIAPRLEWLKSEADEGDIAAQICLADVLYDGEIAERDLSKSKRLLQSAAENGSEYAQRLLARYFDKEK